MSEHQVNDQKKGRAQDYLGLALCAFGGFGAVSVLMQFFGSKEPALAVMRVFTTAEGLLGIFPAFVGMLGMAAIGCVLFLRTERWDAGRHLLGLLGLVLGVSLLLGGFSAESGGAIGGAVSAALGDKLAWLGLFLSILLGFFVIGASAYLSWGEKLQPLLAPLGSAVANMRTSSAETGDLRVGPSDRATPDSEGVTADEAAALVPEATTKPPRRRDPFHEPVSAGTSSAPAPSAPASTEAASAPAPAAPEQTPPAANVQTPAEPTIAQSSPPASSSIEDIAKALSRASQGASRNVPEPLRGPNVEDDIRLRGGIPEGARPLQSDDVPPSYEAAPQQPTREPAAEVEADRNEAPAATDDAGGDAEAAHPAEPAGAHLAGAPADPGKPEPPAPDTLLAELRAANERLKVLDEAASQQQGSAPPSGLSDSATRPSKSAAGSSDEPESGSASQSGKGSSYWSRSGARRSEADREAQATEESGRSSSWEGNTWRPSWESPEPEGAGLDDAGAVAGPTAAWEAEPEAEEELEEVDVPASESTSESSSESSSESTSGPKGTKAEPVVDEVADEEEELEDDEVYAEDEEAEDEDEEDEEEYEDEDEEVYAEDEGDEEDYEEEEDEEEEYEDDEVYAEDEEAEDEDEEDEEDEEEYEDEDEEVYAEDEGDEEDDEEEYEEEDEEEDEEIYAEEADDDEGEEEDEEEPAAEEDQAAEVAKVAAAEAQVDPDPEPAASAESEPAETPAAESAPQVVQADLFGAGEAKAKKTASKKPAAKESEAPAEKAVKPAAKNAQKKAAKKATKKATKKASKKSKDPEPEVESEVVLQPQQAAETAEETPATAIPSDLVIEPRVYESGCMFMDENRVAVSMLQRRYKMDFDEACGILDELQEIGLIGPYLGGKTRDILLSREEWEALARGATQV